MGRCVGVICVLRSETATSSTGRHLVHSLTSTNYHILLYITAESPVFVSRCMCRCVAVCVDWGRMCARLTCTCDLSGKAQVHSKPALHTRLHVYM